MADNISTQRLVNELEDAVKSAKDLLKVFNATEDVTKDIADQLEKAFIGVDNKTSKGIAEFNKLISETNKLTDDSEKLQQEKIKTEAQLIKKEQELSKARIQETKEKDALNKLYLQETKTRIAVRKEQERQLAIFKKGTKAQIKELDAYQKKSKALNEARKKYKALAAAQKATTKEGKALLKNITKLDAELKEIDATVGQNQRSVGKYKDAVKGLNSTIGKLGLAAVIAKGVELLTSAFGDSREGALLMDLQMVKVTETVKVFVNSVIKAVPGFIELFEALKSTFTDIPTQAKIMAKEIEKALSVRSSTKDGIQKEIDALEATLSSSTFSSGLDKIKKAFEGNVDTTEKAIEAQEKYLKLQLATRIAISEQEKDLAGLQERRQMLQDMSDDDTIGFVTREKLRKVAFDSAIEFSNKEVAIAELREKLAFEAVKQDLRRAGIINDTNDTQITTSKQLIALIEEGDNAKKVSDTNDEAFTNAYRERRDAEVESESFKRDQEEKFRKGKRDDFEQELDILEELTEQTINSNLAIINNEKTTAEERNKLIDENKRLTEDLYTDSIALIKKQGLSSIDLRADLTAEQKVKQKALLENLDAQKLLNEEDAKELFILIRKLDLGEIEEKRTKESIKLKKDLTKTNNEVLKSEKKAIKTREELIEDSAEVIEAILTRAREKQNSALDAEIDALDSRIQTIRDAINSGNSEAQQSLAQLEKQKIEAEKKKEELRKKEIRDAKIIAGLQLLAANSNDPNAVGKTLGDVSLLLAALSSLPSFFDGTEDTGTVAKPLDSNGGRHAVLHDNERVMTAKQNAKLGGISNEDLADLGAMHNNGALSGGTTIIQANNKELLQEVREMSKAIKSIPTQTYNYDANGKYHEQVITSRNKKITSKSRANNLFK